MLNEYHDSLLHLPTENGVIKSDIKGWLQPIEAHYLYECAYQSSTILELGCYHGLSTSIMAQAKYDAGNKGSITTLDVFEENISQTKQNIKVDININYVTADAINYVMELNQKPLPEFYDLIFIDANHTYEWMKLLTKNVHILSEGKIVFHDFFHRNTGVQKAVEEILGPPKHKVGSIGVYE